ncbi:MAG: hypothetical protein R2824_32405 [Saprospiraceae bacterium]|nr:hypothetical protein [Lewinella sp.]
MNQFTLLLGLLIVAASGSVYGQQAPCSGPEFRQFDFWVGEWDVYHSTADTIVGYNHIKNILNGCVIEENWTGGSGFLGKSFNTYNPVDSTWNQVWVDAGGSNYHFKGGFTDGRMLLKGETISRQNGQKVLFEMSYTPDPDAHTVRQVWKASRDEGASWNTIFDGVYKKRPTVDGGR